MVNKQVKEIEKRVSIKINEMDKEGCSLAKSMNTLKEKMSFKEAKDTHVELLNIRKSVKDDDEFRRSSEKDVDKELEGGDLDDALLGSQITVAEHAYAKELHERMFNRNLVHFEEHFYSMTVLSMLTTNTDKFKLPISMKGHFTFNVFFLLSFQITMLYCMFAEIYNTYYEHGISVSASRGALLVQLPCAIAMHLVLYPEILLGMELMKFSNNQPDQFGCHGTAKVSFLIGLL